MVITEVGMIPPTSVPVVIREYRENINTPTADVGIDAELATTP